MCYHRKSGWLIPCLDFGNAFIVNDNRKRLRAARSRLKVLTVLWFARWQKRRSVMQRRVGF
jgi:hypothetical protein